PARALAVPSFLLEPDPTSGALAGALGGIGLAFKIVSGFYLLPLALVFALALIRTGQRGFANAAAFAAPAIMAGAPWLLLRWLETGNPVFPFFNNIFHSPQWPPVNERFDLYLYGIGHGMRQAVEIWWEVTVRPERFGQALPSWALGLPLLASF